MVLIPSASLSDLKPLLFMPSLFAASPMKIRFTDFGKPFAEDGDGDGVLHFNVDLVVVISCNGYSIKGFGGHVKARMQKPQKRSINNLGKVHTPQKKEVLDTTPVPPERNMRARHSHDR